MLSKYLAVVLFASTVAAACGGQASSPSTAPSPTAQVPGGTSLPVTIPAGAESLADRAYAPDQLNVPVGTTVTWTNTDSISHTSTSDGSSWNSGILAPGEHFEFAFQTAGTFSYHCTIHPGMVGAIVVR
jgi:plastocyanin